MGVSDDDDLPINIRVITPKEIFEIVESKRVDRQAFIFDFQALEVI